MVAYLHLTRLSHFNPLRDALRFSKQPVIVDQFKMQSHPLNARHIVGGVLLVGAISLIAQFERVPYREQVRSIFVGPRMGCVRGALIKL